MNKSKNEAGQPGTKDDNEQTADNQQVSQPNANTNVVGSREIKFRAFDYFNDVMIYDSDDETDFKFYNGKALIKYVTEQHTVENGIDIDRPVWNQVDGPTMQYTGLKDKNGKEMYEGDIVKIGCKNYKIVFSDYTASFMRETAIGYLRYSLNEYECGGDFEIIGNVFESPELLETLR